MKKIFIALTVLLASFSMADAQKVAYVNTVVHRVHVE